MPEYFTHPLIRENSIERRLYQETIIASCAGKNSLVVLPTGIGKTVIAIGIAAIRLKNHPESKVLVLAPTRPLVEQHRRSFQNVLLAEGFETVTGHNAPDERETKWGQGRVFFATPQVVQNDIITGKVRLQDFSLVVFDEAHRARGDYAYTFIAKKYAERSQNPLILGLTASPGGTREKIGSICGNLLIDNVEIRSEDDSDVQPYIQDVQINRVEVELPEEFVRIKKYLEAALQKRIEHLQKLHLLHAKRPGKRILLALQGEIMMRARDNRDPVLFMAVSACSAAIKLNYCLELLLTQGAVQLREYVKKLQADNKTKSVRSILSDGDFIAAVRILEWVCEHDVEHPKLEALKSLLSENLAEGKKAIVFSQYVSTVEKIAAKIASDKIVPVKFTGQRTGLSQKKQMEILGEFREGKFNVLCATCVAEEGLDIPQVDMIVFYEAIPSEIRTIQRRGRTGRVSAGAVYALIAKGTTDEAFTWVARNREKKMRKILHGMKNAAGITISEMKKAPQSAESGIEVTATNAGDGEKAGAAKAAERGAGQKLLDSYKSAGSTEVKPVIYTDIRETKLLKELVDREVEIRTKQLEVGDFLLSDRVGVERKTVSDFLESIIDGRLFGQLKNLASNFSRPLLIVEGDNLFGERNIHPNAIRGAINSTLVDFRVPIIWTKTTGETADALAAIAKREQSELDRDIQIRGVKRAMTEAEQQEVFVAGFPSINLTLAKRLLAKFGTIKRLVGAGEKRLQSVDGIGAEKAKKIKDFVEKEYVA